MRLLRPALVAALVLSTLSGCFLLPTAEEQRAIEITSTPTPSSEEAVAVGDCWNAEYLEMYYWQTWDGDAAVDCDRLHSWYTFATPDVLDDFDTIHAGGGLVSEEAAAAAMDACQTSFEHLTGVRIEPSESLVVLMFYVPSPKDWKDGDRSLRCDAGLLAVNTIVYDMTFEWLPDDFADVIAAVRELPEAFDLCIDTYEKWELGPYAVNEAYYSDCSGEPVWRLDNLTYFEAESGAAYPSDEAVDDYIRRTCATGYSYFPTEWDWKWYDFRSVECWVWAYEGDEFDGV